MEASALPDAFASYFVEKIKDIKSSLHSVDSEPLASSVETVPEHSFVEFQSLNVDDEVKLVTQMKFKSCAIDPMPSQGVYSAPSPEPLGDSIDLVVSSKILLSETTGPNAMKLLWGF